jgi:hypothetical protein
MTVPAVDPAALRSLLSEVRAGTFDWSLPGLEPVLRRLGWTVIKATAGSGMMIETGWGFEKAIALLRCDDDMVNSMTIFLTEPRRDVVAEAQDAFVEFVALGRSILGPPTGVEPGASPKVRWSDPVATFILQRASTGVIAVWAHTPYHEMLQREIEAQKQDEAQRQEDW